MKDRLTIAVCILLFAFCCAYLYWKHEDCASQGLQMVRTLISIGWSCGKIAD